MLWMSRVQQPNFLDMVTSCVTCKKRFTSKCPYREIKNQLSCKRYYEKINDEAQNASIPSLFQEVCQKRKSVCSSCYRRIGLSWTELFFSVQRLKFYGVLLPDFLISK